MKRVLFGILALSALLLASGSASAHGYGGGRGYGYGGGVRTIAIVNGGGYGANYGCGSYGYGGYPVNNLSFYQRPIVTIVYQPPQVIVSDPGPVITTPAFSAGAAYSAGASYSATLPVLSQVDLAYLSTATVVDAQAYLVRNYGRRFADRLFNRHFNANGGFRGTTGTGTAGTPRPRETAAQEAAERAARAARSAARTGTAPATTATPAAKATRATPGAGTGARRR